jgi:hypothetical protein
MKLIRFVRRIFYNQIFTHTVFSEALEEGFNATFKEMGHPIGEKAKR